MTFTSYFGDGAPGGAEGREGYLRVRVSDDFLPTGYVTVYLANGTSLLVPAEEVLSFATANRSALDAIEDSVRLSP